MMTLITVVGCPIAAGAAAASQKAGWFTIVWVLFGVALGVGFSYCVRGVAYFLLFAGCKQRAPFVALTLLAYTLVTPAVAFGSIAVSAVVTAWLLATHVF